MKKIQWRRLVAVVGAAALLGFGLIGFVYRPWALHWGATRAEIGHRMAGDGLLANPNFRATRAVTVAAPPSEIWPWLVQMGYGKAGFYSYDRIDNDGIPSAVEIVPRYQHVQVGDSIPLTAHDFVVVSVMAPDRSMLWEYRGGGDTVVFTWSWRLYPVGERSTRLVTRLQYRAAGLHERLMLDLFEIIMMRKCMLGIRERAERGMASPAEVVT